MYNGLCGTLWNLIDSEINSLTKYSESILTISASADRDRWLAQFILLVIA